MKLDLFDYNLPPEAIAQSPADPRDSSRLLIVRRETGALEHRHFYDLPSYLRPGDLLVLNNTRVRAARVEARRLTGGRLELLVLEIRGRRECRALVNPARRALPGTVMVFADGRQATILSKTPDGGRELEFEEGVDLEEWLETHGEAPLPPYIHSTLEDPARYQTVYSKELGSAAAPTAGLHFTPALLDAVREAGAAVAEVTLHVGLDTFRPVKVEEIERHEMHSEWYDVPEPTARAVREASGRIIAIGTTAVRTLEAAAVGPREVNSGVGSTRLYITPGYQFQCVDAMVTNFHVPRSTLLIMVSAFVGREKILHAYHTALETGYRFLSLGDAMFIL